MPVVCADDLSIQNRLCSVPVLQETLNTWEINYLSKKKELLLYMSVHQEALDRYLFML